MGSTSENVVRIKRQNSCRISVIIGNPPYYANQENENDNNKSRPYPDIDRRIKETYIAESSAQKTKAYDMYTRFYRWASARLDANGIIAFITNRSFIGKDSFDGFRKVVAKEFNEIYVLDLGGGVKDNPKLSGPKHNVFGIATGVAIAFMVKRENGKGCRIHYSRRPEFEAAEDKLALLNSARFTDIEFERINPDAEGNWIDLVEDDDRDEFASLIPLISKRAKAAKKPEQVRALFHLFACGIKTNRDEWVYDFSPSALKRKVDFQTKKLLAGGRGHDPNIKWSRDLKLKVARGITDKDIQGTTIQSLWRPFVKKTYWANKTLSDILTEYHYRIFGKDLTGTNPCFLISVGKRGKCAVLAVEIPPNYDMFVPDVGQIVSRWQIDKSGARVDNITDWGLRKFQARYPQGRSRQRRPITKDAIFHYVYGVLNDPQYREKYAASLKREFPGIPFHEDFWQWAEWGERLMELHLGYEAVTPFPLKRSDTSPTKRSQRPILKADKATGRIIIDSHTELSGVPTQAWDYGVGNRSALEWILDQYREKTPKDPTIREKFDAYHFADHKEAVIDLIARVTTVSVETQKIVEAMRMMSRSASAEQPTAKASYSRPRR